MAKVKSKKLEEFESIKYENENIELVELGTVVKNDMSEYGDLVISGRAIPSILDGMKPVQRRICDSFRRLNKVGGVNKCALFVGDVLGNTHPHGDTSIYQALVEMVLPFKNRFPLFQKQGNFGSIEDDGAAGMRYTEVGMPSDSHDLLFQNINKENVIPWKLNYSDKLLEPVVLPVKYPLHILNGTFGIGYSTVTTKIPSYNLVEITKLYTYLIDNKFWESDFEVEDHKKKILKIIPCPDMPTGTNIYFDKDQTAESTIFDSKFRFRMRANYKIDEKHNQIIFDNIPMETDALKIKEEIQKAGLSYNTIKGKKIDKNSLEILNISENADVFHTSTVDDKSYLNDAQIQVTFKKGSSLSTELMKLFKYTSLDNGFAGKMMVIDEEGRPVLKSLYEQTVTFLNFRLHTAYQGYMVDITKLKEQLHLLRAFITILGDLDYFIDLVRNNEDSVIKEKMKEKYSFDESQIDYLLSLQIRKLSKTSIEKIEDEVKDKEAKLVVLETLISSKSNLFEDIKKDYTEILTKTRFKGKKVKRFSQIIQAKKDIDPSDLIVDKPVIIMYMEDDSIAYVDKNKFRLKNKGTKTTENKINNDFELNLKISESCMLKDTLLLMTSKGKVFKLKTYMFVEQFRYIGNLIKLDKDEKLVNILKFNENDNFYMITTKSGKIKGVKADLFKNTTSNRAIKSITLKDNDKVVSFSPYQNDLKEEEYMKLNDGKKSNEKIILLTNDGQIMKYPTSEISVIAGSGQGSKACTLTNGQSILKTFVFNETSKTIIVGVSNIGRAKKTLTSKITDKHRTNKTNLFFENNETNGKMVCGEVFSDSETEALMTLTEKSDVSLTKLNGFNSVNRTAKGSIILLKMDNDEAIKLCKKIKIEELSDSQSSILKDAEEKE